MGVATRSAKRVDMPTSFAVGFDFDHTLGLDNKLERTVALEMLGGYARSRDVAYDVGEAERAIDEALARSRGGGAPIELAIAGFFEQFVPAGAAAFDTAQDFRETVVARAPEFVTVLPGAESLLATLDEAGIRYALLTNGWSPLQEEKARLIGFRGSVFVSERIDARKPDRAAFDQLLKHFELPATAVWYVGDDPVTDVAGAAAAGLTSVWFDWEGRSYPQELARAHHTIASLDELPALLQGRSDRL